MNLRWIPALLLLPALGCNSVHAWTADRAFVPLAAGGEHAASARGLGRLHRLLLPTPSCVIERDGRHASDEEAVCAREVHERAFTLLRDELGYDVLLPDLLGSAGGPQAEAASQLADSLGEVDRFALASADGAPPPPALASRVREVCAAWQADGLVRIRIEEQRPSIWNWLLLAATLLQSWPVLVLGQHVDARIDVFEAASGELVWRYSERLRPLPDSLDFVLQGPFGAIEAAAPREGAE